MNWSNNIDLERTKCLAFWFLLVHIFIASTATTSISVIYNRMLVSYVELSFLLVYLGYVRDFAAIWQRLCSNKLLVSLFGGYFVILYGTSLARYLTIDIGFQISMHRAFENSLHLIFALCAYDVIVKRGVAGAHCRDVGIIAASIFLPGVIFLVVFGVAWLREDCSHASCFNWLLSGPLRANVRFTGEQVAVCTVVALAAYLSLAANKARLLKYSGLLSAGLCFGFVVWLGGRGSFLSVTILTLFCCMLVVWQRRYGAAIVVLVVVTSTTLLAESIAVFSWSGIFSSAGAIAGDDYSSIAAASNNRLDIWLENWALILQRPWFGYGGDAFQFLEQRIDNGGYHPHNVVIQYLLDVGFVGAGAFILGMCLFVKKYIGQLWDQQSGLILMGYLGLACLSLDGLSQATFYNGVPSMLVVFMMACIAAGAQHTRLDGEGN